MGIYGWWHVGVGLDRSEDAYQGMQGSSIITQILTIGPFLRDWVRRHIFYCVGSGDWPGRVAHDRQRMHFDRNVETLYEFLGKRHRWGLYAR